MYLFPALLLTLGLAGCADAQSERAGGLRQYDFGAAPSARIELPGELAEVSGLATSADGRLFAHGDERAVVYQIELPAGRIVKRFGIGDAGGPLAGDFEDIQIVGDRFFLVTSEGQLIEAKEGADGATVPVVRRSRGVGGACEVEGLSWDASSSAMLLLCKETKGKQWKDRLVILAVDPATGKFEPEPRLTVPQKDLQQATGAKRFAGSGIVRHPKSGNWILVSGPQRAIAEIDAAGTVLGGALLRVRRHRQPEGIAVAQDQTLLISDEAAGGKATITGYAIRR